MKKKQVTTAEISKVAQEFYGLTDSDLKLIGQMQDAMDKLIKLRPLHDNLLVKRIPERDSGLIIAPDMAKTKKTMQAKVISVGPGRWVDGVFTKTAIKPGDVVLLPGIAAQIPDWESKDLVIVNERDVGGILVDA